MRACGVYFVNVVERDRMVLQGIWFTVLFTVAVSDTVDPVSYLWPIPQSVKCNSELVYTITENFNFQGAGAGGELPTLTGAFERYRKFVSPSALKVSTVSANTMVLESLMVEVASADETLGLDTDESCESLGQVRLQRSRVITLAYR